MAGAGYKLFNTGDVLTAAQVNTYLQEQTVMVFANATARTTALSGVLAEGMMSYLQDTNAVEVYNGTSWVNVGNVGDITEVQAGVGISIASGTGPIPVITNSSTDLITSAGDLLYGTAADTVARLGIGTAGQVLTVNSGATAPEWAAPAGFAYANYTPTFTGFTKGNANVVARYAQSGKAVNVFVAVTLGNTSSVTGAITVTLPVTAASAAEGSRGIGAIVDTGVRAFSMVPVVISTTAVELKPLAASLATTAEDDISSTNPMTWTTNDKFIFSLTYEAA